ncbi:MAG: ArdC family protein [Alphaproteobacteria bacterium]|nr:ArdC family protein [Alphaproteobacteria bacterium]
MPKGEPVRRDIHAEVTNQLLAAIEASPGQFTLPWRKSAGALHIPVNALTGKAYNGINVVSLWVAAEVLGYSTPIWGTYRQWLERGAQVRKGEKSSLVVFYREYESTPDPDDADDNGRRRVCPSSQGQVQPRCTELAKSNVTRPSRQHRSLVRCC